MSFVLLGILNSQAAGAGGFSYRLQTLGGTGTEVGNSVAIDSADNIYTFGETNSTGSGLDDLLLVKYDFAGTLQWQRELGGTGDENANGLAIDSADNIYVGAWTGSAGQGGREFYIAKYDSSGSVLWQRTLGGTGTDYRTSLATDSSNNVYMVGESNSSGGPGLANIVFAKYSSSGTLQFQRYLAGNSINVGDGVGVDSANNVYVIGHSNNGGIGGDDFIIAKYNTTGIIQWQRAFGGSSIDQAQAVAFDSSNNLYVAGYSGSTGFSGVSFLIAKYNSSGTLQWQRAIEGNDYSSPQLAVDSADNLYLVGYTDDGGASNEDFVIVKYNSSGTLQWQRTLGNSGNEVGKGVALDSLDNLYVFGSTTSTGEGGSDFLLGVLPNDGSLTGTYVLDGVNIVYAASSISTSTTSLTSQSSSLTDTTSSLVSASASLTSAAASLTEHRVDL